MDTPPLVALVLLLGALPICLWVAHADLSRLKIPNRAVLALAGLYAGGGLLLALLPDRILADWTLADWGWRFAHLVVVLLLGMALNAASLIGAGDAKFAAAMAPFVASSDVTVALTLLPLMLLLCWLLHRLARATAGPRLAVGWASWSSGKRFPMGIALAATLLAYLGLCAAA